MTKYILRRILLIIPLVFSITTILFFVLKLIPGDPLAFLEQQSTFSLTEEQREAKMEALGLNDPLHEQYIRYMRGLILHGDMGRSVRTNNPVTYEILTRLPDTIVLALSSLALATALSLPLGVLAALQRGRWLDRLIMFMSLFFVSMPAFFFGLILLLIFALELDLFPSLGQGRTFTAYVHSLILPAVTLSLILIGVTTRMVRSSMLEVLSRDYVRTAHAKGVPGAHVVFGHALPNAMIPVLTIYAGQLSGLLGGAVVIERIFSWPGIGEVLVSAIFNRDYLVVTGVTLTFSLLVISVYLLLDITYAFVDPRVRLE
ncbi:MAG: ABC transporter permease [Anaerolineaceae bacterium]|nr:ABC transporter permease [Chloroflexota bacterium]MCY4009850.1 ABC transporter permease [Anaerolineaceae bacterium]